MDPVAAPPPETSAYLPPGLLRDPWFATLSDETLRAATIDSEAGVDEPPGATTGGWDAIDVPGHWRSHPAFSTADGPLLYRTDLLSPAAASADDTDHRWWLTFDGVFHNSDLWLDGTYLGDTEGYFVPHSFEVTDLLAARSEHRLVAEVACAPQRDRTKKRLLTGVFQHWDCLPADLNPGGIWRPVTLSRTGPVRIVHFRSRCRDANEETAIVALRAVIDTPTTATVSLRTRIGDTEHVTEQPLAAGQNRVEWTVAVDRPDRWWPHALGSPALHDLTVEVLLDGGAVSDLRRRRIGLRSLEMHKWVLRVNGERLFLKGTNLAPRRALLAEASAGEIADDIASARDANLDFVRVHAHIARPELYEAADEAGMLVWQDLPLQWGYARSVRSQARRQAREAVDLLGHHPSIFLWCGHNEPVAIDADPVSLAEPRRRARLAARAAVGMVLPSWNRSVLDLAIKRVLEETDGTRPVVAHSGVWPHPPQLSGTDSHLYFGWYHGSAGDLPRFAARWPRMVRFVSEFGAQAVPASAADYADPQRWPDLDWTRLATDHALQRWAFDRVVPSADHASFVEWMEATQRYQANLVARQIETLRRLKYRPTGGFAHFLLADAVPAVTWSVLDHERTPKLAYGALVEACAPVIVVADELPAEVTPGQVLSLEIHAVNDRRVDLSDMVASADLSNGGDLRWTWSGDLAADCCARIGRIDFTVADLPPGAVVRLDLALDGAGESATNTYSARVTPIAN